LTSLILVGGGSSSGKSTISKRIIEKLSAYQVATVCHDRYYKDLGHLSPKEIKDYNFDHPDAIDHTQLIRDIRTALNSETIRVPVYDFVTHTRKPLPEEIPPSEVIIVEGIFALFFSELREIADLKIYVDVQSDICLVRRIRRDIAERGFTIDLVLDQYLQTVRPMHEAFVEPTKKYADIVIPGDRSFEKALRMIDGFVLSNIIEELNR